MSGFKYWKQCSKDPCWLQVRVSCRLETIRVQPFHRLLQTEPTTAGVWPGAECDSLHDDPQRKGSLCQWSHGTQVMMLTWKLFLWKSFPGLKSTILPSKADAGRNHKLLSKPKLRIFLQDFQPWSDRRVWPSQPRVQHSTARYLPHTLSSLARPESACHHQVYIQGWVSFAHKYMYEWIVSQLWRKYRMASKADFSMPAHLTMQKSYLVLAASSLMQRLGGSKLEMHQPKCVNMFSPLDLGWSWSLHHPRSSPQLHHHHANARPVRELWQTSGRTKPWEHPLKYFITGWHPKVQGYWRCLKNCYDPAGDKRPKTKFHVQNWKQADASVRSLANWFSLGDLAGDKTRAEMSVPEGEAYDNLLRDLTNVRTKDQQVPNDSICFRQTPSWFEMRQKLWSSTASSS